MNVPMPRHCGLTRTPKQEVEGVSEAGGAHSYC
jgi:hypothetical protein